MKLCIALLFTRDAKVIHKVNVLEVIRAFCITFIMCPFICPVYCSISLSLFYGSYSLHSLIIARAFMQFSNGIESDKHRNSLRISSPLNLNVF